MKSFLIKILISLCFCNHAICAIIPDVSNCNLLPQYLSACSNFQCKLNFSHKPIEATMFVNVLGQENNLCKYSFLRSFVVDVNGSARRMRIKLDCKLSQDGINEVINQFREYASGNVDIFLQSSDSKIIRKECKESF